MRLRSKLEEVATGQARDQAVDRYDGKNYLASGSGDTLNNGTQQTSGNGESVKTARTSKRQRRLGISKHDTRITVNREPDRSQAELEAVLGTTYAHKDQYK